ncbi:aldehyde dehydrogenase family protein, partial [Shigella sonnei]|nr:aldehyde dehydrogenase family protein [Shigella sonnei]EGA7352158.1 aldehyde dehydrogenase family protein [Shigella sonnei]
MFQRLPCMDDFCRKINVNDKISPAGTVAIDQFVNRLGEAMQAVKFGNPAERNDIAMGPLINAAALERVEQKVARAVEEGARVALGGKAVEGKGYYYPPTLLLDVRQDMSIMHEETFGPVLPVVAFDTLEEAISMANDSDYGLTS